MDSKQRGGNWKNMGLHTNPDSIPVLLTEQLDRAAEHFPDKTAIYFHESTIFYAQLKHRVDALAAHLIARNVRRGDCILLAFERRPEIIISFLAVVKAGGIAVPLNFKGSEREIDKIRNLSHPTGTLYQPELLHAIRKPTGSEWIQAVDLDDKALFSTEFDPEGFPDLDPNDTIYLNFTSGSTGLPKAASATHRQLYANTRDCCDVLGLTDADVHLPLFAVMLHPHEMFCRALMTGAGIVLINNLYPRSIANAVTQKHVTCIMAVSPVYELLLPFARNPEYDFSSLRIPESGGMATPDGLRERFRETFGVPIVPVWGSTESMGIAFAPVNNREPPLGSVGRLLPSYSVKLVNSEGQEVLHGDVGELYIRGAGVTRGYWNDPEITRRSFVDGWYKTGDLFRVDSDGNYYFCGRTDAMIKMGGHKVYPAEIEAVLFSHPLISEAVVVPYSDRLRGVVPLAAMVVSPGETLTESQVRQYLRRRLPRYKLPRIYRFLHDMPRAGGGKINRKALLSNVTESEEFQDAGLKHRIESIDLKILHLLNERLILVLKLQELSNKKGFDPEDTQETIQRLLEFNPGPLHDSIVEKLFQLILSIQQYL